MAENRTTPLARPAWLPHSVWPFETLGIRVHGVRLAVTDVGSGPTLLFVHTGTWSFLWRDLIAELSAEFRCVCFDAPGTGRSERIPPVQATLDSAQSAALGVIDALDLRRFTLVVHDLGGLSGLGAAAAMPERVAGIVAMNTFAWTPAEWPLRAMLALMGSRIVEEVDGLTNFMGWIASSSFGTGRHLDAPSRRAFRMGSSGTARRAFHRYMRSALTSEALYRRVQTALTGELAAVPVLTVFGERNDPFGFQARWKAIFPHARQVVVANGHHFPMCDAPSLVAGAIRRWICAHATNGRAPLERSLEHERQL